MIFGGSRIRRPAGSSVKGAIQGNRDVLNPPLPPKYVAIPLNFGRSGGISLNRAPSPQSRPDGGSADHRGFSGFHEDISTQSAAESWGAKFHPFGPSKWRFRRISARRAESPMNRAPSPQNRPGGGSANRRNFQGPLVMFLHNRPQIRWVRNPTLSAQVSGDFSEFRQIGRDFPESRPPRR